VLTQEEKQILNQFIMTRPLNGLNLYDAQKMLEILTKINKMEGENSGQ
jgi:hypothetical protein